VLNSEFFLGFFFCKSGPWISQSFDRFNPSALIKVKAQICIALNELICKALSDICYILNLKLKL